MQFYGEIFDLDSLKKFFRLLIKDIWEDYF